jgi:hypothetical protein
LLFIHNMSLSNKRPDDAVVLQRLADLLGVDAGTATVKRSPKSTSSQRIDLADLAFAAELTGKGDAASVGQAIRVAQAAAKQWKPQALPLVVVPYMGAVGQQLCQEAAVCWLDRSGNASLQGKPGLRIQIEGKPNLFKSAGRPQNLFAPKSARIARCLLMQPQRPFTQRELAETSGLDEGFTSRIVRGMEAQALLQRNDAGAVSMPEPELMLEAWREAYDFNKHRIVRGHMATRSGMDSVKQIATTLERHHIRYAATGLAGAWCVNHFAGFRLATVYHDGLLDEAIRTELGFREESRGANVWLISPNDTGIFQGAEARDGIQCAHPVQLYMDLKNQPERAQEASEALKASLWEDHES